MDVVGAARTCGDLGDGSTDPHGLGGDLSSGYSCTDISPSGPSSTRHTDFGGSKTRVVGRELYTLSALMSLLLDDAGSPP